MTAKFGQMDANGVTNRTPTYTGQVLANGDDLLNNRTLGAGYRVVRYWGSSNQNRESVAFFGLIGWPLA